MTSDSIVLLLLLRRVSYDYGENIPGIRRTIFTVYSYSQSVLAHCLYDCAQEVSRHSPSGDWRLSFFLLPFDDGSAVGTRRHLDVFHYGLQPSALTCTMVRVRQPLHPRRRMGIKMKWLLGGGAAMILMDVHLTNKVSVPSVPNHEHVQLIALQLDRKVPDSSRRSIPGTFNALSNRSTTRLGVLPAADSLAEHAGNVVPIQRKGYPLPTNSSIVSSEGIKALKMLSYWGNNKFCRDIRRPRPSLQPMVFNITFGCQELFSVSGMGTGNWMSAL
jgi:hypothetical protein